MDYKELLERDGYVRIPEILNQEELEKLRAAASRSTEYARAGKWPFVRTVPKQFPPWTNDISQGIWGVQHLMHPDLPDHELFTATYFNDKVFDVVKQLLSCGSDDLVMELYNMLIRPDTDFELRWHRDDVPPTATAEEEIERLKEPAFHAQWNMPLYDDYSLIVVPGSHSRPRTDDERNADPYQEKLPHMEVVEMKAGDVIFYDNNILHRGVYDSTKERMTLHGTIGHAKGNKSRARNVLQHGVGDWVSQIDFNSLPDKKMTKQAEDMRDRLIVMGAENPDHGYSQDD